MQTKQSSPWPVPRISPPLVFLGLLGGCGAASPEQSPVEVEGRTPSTPSELTGRTRYDASCRPFNAALIDRSMFYARVVNESWAFQTCVRNTMNARYMNCNDPNASLSRGQQIDRALETMQIANNGIAFTCDDTNGDASAFNQGYRTPYQVTIFTQNAQNETNGDWPTYGADAGGGDDYEPWNWRTATMLHEFSHTMDYNHIDLYCRGTCGDSTCNFCSDPTCAWTTRCGGSGTPPSSVTSLATAGRAQQEYCAFRNRGDDTAYYQGGDPAFPYILSECAHNLIVESHEACGKATAEGACGDWASLRLLSSWTGTASTEQSDTASCVCLDDPRKMVALRTSSGRALTAQLGGGGPVLTNYSDRVGAWQWFYMIDQSGGSLTSGDSVQLKSHWGHWLQTDYSVAGLTRKSHAIYRSDGLGPIGNGTSVYFYNTYVNPVTLASEPRYAYAGASTLAYSSALGSGSEYRFTVERPRRDTLVYLGATRIGRYVRIDSLGSWLAYADRTASEIATGSQRVRGEAALWLVDHNGGELMSGDSVSFETFYDDSYMYLGVEPGTGQARAETGIGPRERFVVTKVSGGDARIRHDDTIALRSATGHYLTAVSPGSGGQLTNASTLIGLPQRFTLRHVSQHDQPRATW